MHTLSMGCLNDQWYMDTKATSHVIANRGNLTSYSNMNNNIIVSHGLDIPIIIPGNALVRNPHHYPTYTMSYMHQK